MIVAHSIKTLLFPRLLSLLNLTYKKLTSLSGTKTSSCLSRLQIRKICDISSQPERIESTLSLLNNETDEFKILEATKLLMYDSAVQLYRRLSRGDEVPVFAMLLFARDSCESPRGLLTNHLNRTGDTGGLEQVSKLLSQPPPLLVPPE